MQLPSVDRQPGLRPAGADLVSSNGAKVIPVAPVNPPVQVETPGVVNNISDGAASVGKLVYKGVSDPVQNRPEAATSPKDWTIQRPAPEKVEFPPPEPISKLLLEFLRSMWRASGGAIEMAQVQNQNLQVNQQNPLAAPGQFAKEELTYSPSKIKKNEKT